MTAPLPMADPATDLRIARLHLRMGQLGLARAELEALAGSGDLDDDGLLALAEARWRTGDLSGAGEAAQAYLAGDGDDVLALVIAAEAVAAVGRPGEARRIAGRALEQKGVPLDRLFAGMPRSSVWPADPAEGSQPAGTLFGDAGSAMPAPPVRGDVPTPRPAQPDGPGFWDTDSQAVLPDGATELAVARGALLAGDPRAALRLALVLRAAPELASEVVAAIESADRSPELEIVRGDAFGLLGRHDDARLAYASAAALDREAAHVPAQEER